MGSNNVMSTHSRNPCKFLVPILIFFLAVAALQLSFIAVPIKAPAQSNSPDSNAPQADGDVDALTIANGVTYVAGDFTKVGNSEGICMAAISSNGSARVYDGFGSVGAIAVAGNTIYVGGGFHTFGQDWPPIQRNHLGAIDAGSGALLDWNPNADELVTDMVVSGNTLYAVGFFNTVGGKPRNKIAAFNATTGELLDWNPGLEITTGLGGEPCLRAVKVSGNAVYVGGWFSRVGSSSRWSAAAFDATTGALLPWDPSVDGKVWSLAVDAGTVYLSGEFPYVGGAERR